MRGRTGDKSEEGTPVPIPNTEVKLFSPDDTVWATAWENRTSPFHPLTRAVLFCPQSRQALIKDVMADGRPAGLPSAITSFIRKREEKPAHLISYIFLLERALISVFLGVVADYWQFEVFALEGIDQQNQPDNEESYSHQAKDAAKPTVDNGRAITHGEHQPLLDNEKNGRRA
jgi:hypothetical protein